MPPVPSSVPAAKAMPKLPQELKRGLEEIVAGIELVQRKIRSNEATLGAIPRFPRNNEVEAKRCALHAEFDVFKQWARKATGETPSAASSAALPVAVPETSVKEESVKEEP